MDRLFTMDEEDKINLKVETPLTISRIQWRKEMSTSLKPLTKESDEDNASQNIVYFLFPIVYLIVKSILIAVSHMNKVFGSSVLL